MVSAFLLPRLSTCRHARDLNLVFNITNMARLHPKLKDALHVVPADQPLHLLTRHSVRELASNGFADYRLPLTEEGVRMAEAWGQELGRPVTAFYSSPVGRCIDTAIALRKGGLHAGIIAKELPIEKCAELVEPGCYVEDINVVGPAFFKMGAVGFINHHLSEDMMGLLTPQAGQEKLIRYLQARDPAQGELAVHVTHDTILMAFVASLLGLKQVTESDWPWMMEGLWLWLDASHINWVWRGEQGRLALGYH